MNLFYSDNINDTEAFLREDEYIHCCKVLRKKIGVQIHITDGKGRQAKATIESISKKEAHLRIIETIFHDPKQSLTTIAIAPPKNRSRWEWFVEKSVEIGIDLIIPLRTKNSERIKINKDRSKKIMRSAALQSLRYHHPEVSDIQSLDELYRLQISDQPYTRKYLAHYNPTHPHLRDISDGQENKLVIIGPEGDFTESEIEEALQNKIQLVNLSSNRLRTETAGLIATNLIIE